MKKLILLTLLLIFSAISAGAWNPCVVTSGKKAAGGVSCITLSGDLLQESFNTSPGYDDADWDEDANNPDEDNTDALTENCYVTEWLKASGSDIWARNTLGSTQAQVYLSFYVIITAESLANTEDAHVASICDAGSSRKLECTVYDNAGQLELRFESSTGQICSGECNISLNTEYLVKIWCRNGGAGDAQSYEVRLVSNNSEVCSGAATDNVSADLQDLMFGPWSDVATVTLYFDNIDADSTDFAS